MDKDISYIAFESVCARLERTIKRLWIVVIILVMLLVGTNCAWLWYEAQFQEVTTEASQDVETDNDGDVVVSGTGDIDYGNED